MPSTTTTSQLTTQSPEFALHSLLASLQGLQLKVLAPRAISKSFHTTVIKTIDSLRTFALTSAVSPAVAVAVSNDLLEYVENGRNPEIYLRDFIELVQRSNQKLRGCQEGFHDFARALAEEMSKVDDFKDATELVMTPKVG